MYYDVGKQKKEIRKNVLALRDGITASDREKYDARIKTNVTDRNEYREAQVILAYASYLSEVDTGALIRQALADGKGVFVPKVCGDEMEFWQIETPGALKEGYRGIPEPEEESISFPEWVRRWLENFGVCSADISVRGENTENGTDRGIKAMMWMPGAVFDEQRHRIGYGKGFYDRYLHGFYNWEKTIRERHTGTEIRLKTAALAYQCQVLAIVPYERHDIRPDILITEQGVYCEEAMS